MTQSRVHSEIERLLGTLDGELTSHSRIVDALLDVRGATADRQVIAMVDDALRDIPGKNAAETQWLRERLGYFALMHEMSLAVSERSTVV